MRSADAKGAFQQVESLIYSAVRAKILPLSLYNEHSKQHLVTSMTFTDRVLIEMRTDFSMEI